MSKLKASDKEKETKKKTADILPSNSFEVDNIDDDEDEEDEGPFCHLCLDGSSYDNNEIIFCDKCDVAVHQTCYGVPVIPEGSWYCYVCAAGGNPQKTACFLCSNTGGAYKATNIPGVWAHGLCAAWIPEVFATDHTGRILSLDYIDPKREKLKCSLCSSKGSCVQCAYGRCTTAVHPWCCLIDPRGYTHRIVKNEKDESVWEIFCKTHAQSVFEPVKPKSKAKSHPIKQNDDGYESDDRHNNKSSNGRSSRHSRVVDSSSDEDDDLASNGLMKRGGKGKAPSTSIDSATQPPKTSSAFKLSNFLTLSEWPGQAEGEGLDLDHFWNYTSSAFPEDQPAEWLESMMSGLLETIEAEDAMSEELMELPSKESGNPMDVVEKSSSLLSDRDRAVVYDVEKRTQLLSNAYQDLHILYKASNQDATSSITNRVSSGLCTYLDASTANVDAVQQLLTGRASSSNAVEAVPRSIQSGDKCDHMLVAFDGDHRYVCQFTVTPTSSDSIVESESTPVLGIESIDDWTEKHLIGRTTSSTSYNGDVSPINQLSLSLQSYNAYPGMKTIKLANGEEIIAKDDDDIVSRMLISDQLAYSRLMKTIKERIYALATADELRALGGINPPLRESYAATEVLYFKQQIWRRIARGFHSGVRDHGDDFNVQQLDQVPESWKILVDGRPIPQASDNNDDGDIAEDTICMCCFDGTSVEGNRILFCDGCNATMHQACYGIAEIPEGEFYCERCKEVQYASRSMGKNFNRYDAMKLVSCCLCPVKHGGIKPTTDGRWVHLCCAIWSKNAVIKELADMSPIDVSGVEIQRPIQNRVSSLFDQPCRICNNFGGYVVKCNGCDGDDHPCDIVFHPLCAWFEGCYLSTSVVDPTFQGNDREGIFPSGLSFQYYCYKHSQPSSSSAGTRMTQAVYQSIIDNRRQQMQLRRKYMMKEEDLACIPGANNKRRKYNKKSKKEASGDGGGSSARSARPVQQVQEKELTVDVYDSKMCAICMSSADPLSECEEWRKFQCVEIPSKPVPPELNTETLSMNHNDITTSSTTVTSVILSYKMIVDDTCIGPTDSNLIDVDIGSQPVALSIPDDVAPILSHLQLESSDDNLQPPTTSSSSLSSNGAPNANHTNMNGKSSSLPLLVSCKSCGITVHTSCLQDLTPTSLSKSTSMLPSWLCPPCQYEQPQVNLSCILCPRRGGFFLNTTDGNWCHIYCIKHSSCQWKIMSIGDDDTSSHHNQQHIINTVIDIRSYPKQKNAKHKCTICNRKVGISECCRYPGCIAHFHPLCGERSGRGYINIRANVSEYYCSDHIPDGIERVSYRVHTSNGMPSITRHWVNSAEMQRLRYVLVRSSTVLDSISRREKYKRLLSKADGEFFAMKLKSQLDKAKGRKNDGLSGVDIGELFDDSDEDDMHEFMGDDVEYMSDAGGDMDLLNPANVLPSSISHRNGSRRKRGGDHKSSSVTSSVDDWIPGHPPEVIRGTDMMISLLHHDTDEDHVDDADHDNDMVRISAHYNDGSSIILPPRIFIGIGGYEFDKRETLIEGGSRAFLRIFKERMMSVVERSRDACGIFTTSQQANEFNRKVGPQLLKHMHMSIDELKPILAKEGLSYEYPKEVKDKAKDKDKTKPAKKRGYVLVEFDEDEDDIDEEIEKPLSSRRKSKKSSSSYQYDDDDDEDMMISSGTACRNKRSSLHKRMSIPDDVEEDNDYDLLPVHNKGRHKSSSDVVPSESKTSSSSKASHRRDSASSSIKDDIPVQISSTVAGKKRKRVEVEDKEEKTAPPPEIINTSSSPSKAQKRKSHDHHHPSSSSSHDHRIAAKYYSAPANMLSTDINSRRLAMNSAGAYLSRKQLIAALDADPLTKAMIINIPVSSSMRDMSIESEPMDDLFSITGIQLPSLSACVDDEWRLYDEDSLPELERRIQDIIHIIEAKEIPETIDESSSSTSPSTAKNGRGHKKNKKKVDDEVPVEMRPLCEDFSEIPAESFPEYSNYVRHVLTIEVLKAKLHDHMFRSMAAFNKSFYEMLNNARAVTPIDSKTWSDADELAKLFEEAKESTLSPESSSKSPEHIVTYTKKDAKETAKNDNVVMTCVDCSGDYFAWNWPDDFHMNKKDKWSWLCNDCVERHGRNLIGKQVRVWWHDDAVAYVGVIDAYDRVTSRYRVSYEVDDEWEFVSLSYEPALIAMARDNDADGQDESVSHAVVEEPKSSKKRRR